MDPGVPVAVETSFADVLRRERRAAGLSQEELAERAAMSARGIGALETGERRSPHPSTARRLADALDLTGERRAALLAASHGPGRREAAASSRRPSRITVVEELPLPELVGRHGELAELGALVGGGERLVTVVGPGGVGKTLLARYAARSLRPQFRDGVAVVDLAGVSDAAQVPVAVLSVLSAGDGGTRSPSSRLRSALSDRHQLLVLDNLEHLDGVADVVAGLVREATGITVLGTSRRALDVAGERRFLLAPLPVPAADDGVDVAAGSAAVQLFVLRVSEVVPGFAVDSDSSSTVVQLCRRLDGLPLALELAARWVRVLPLPSLLTQLEERLTVIDGRPGRPERQRSLMASLGWSEARLGADARTMLRLVAPFRAGAPLDAAVQLAVGRCTDPIGALADLVDASLIRMVAGTDEPRYRLLETVRAYVLGTGEADTDAVLDARDAWAIALARRARAHLRGPTQEAWLGRLEAEHATLRDVLARLVAMGDGPRAARLAGDLWWFWYLGGHWFEGRAALEQVATTSSVDDAAAGDVAAVQTGLTVLRARHGLRAEAAASATTAHDSAAADGRASVRADALYADALASSLAGDYERAVRSYEEAIRLQRLAADRDALGDSLNYLGYTLWRGGDSARARACFEEARELFSRPGHRFGLGRSLFGLAEICLADGRIDEASALLLQTLRQDEEWGYARGVAGCHLGLGWVAVHHDDLTTADSELRLAVALFSTLGDTLFLASCTSGLATVAQRRGSFVEAARLLGCCDALPGTVSFRDVHEQTVLAVRSALGAGFDAAHAEGATLSLTALLAR